MPCPNKITLRAYLTPEEYKVIKAHAGQARLSVSVYVKAVCLGYEVKSDADQDAILDLLKLRADLGRLGGLLKLGLSQNTLDRHRANQLLWGIEKTKQQLDEKVRAI